MPENKLARRSFGDEPYRCTKDWPEDCFVQCGGHGLVVPSGSFQKMLTREKLSDSESKKLKEESYTTAFFEAFPNDPPTFIRGEGKTIEEAEEAAWKEWERYSSCPSHEFEKRNYTNGAGFCKHCGMFKSHAFEPEEGE